jgi:hypothetical protein
LSIWVERETTLKEMEFLLQISPVKRLYLEIGSDTLTGGFMPCNFVRLAQILNDCPTLKHVELRVWRLDEQFNIEQIRQLSPWLATLDLKYGYVGRESLQTHNYRLKSKHLRF